jgi:hypothetical protein
MLFITLGDGQMDPSPRPKRSANQPSSQPTEPAHRVFRPLLMRSPPPCVPPHDGESKAGTPVVDRSMTHSSSCSPHETSKESATFFIITSHFFRGKPLSDRHFVVSLSCKLLGGRDEEQRPNLLFLKIGPPLDMNIQRKI